ncbi:histidine triad nucleotide-binding protein 3-like [Diaphorina citri]|uniref:Adenosine 5'-monophosphoramidase HINT3 n=1 Tax=Diaphorina citri TaxID=121845 RepID=A0A1S3DLB7_DIACI|nr:histidine triad nucleotide-binding protein 3-like [Diaphorina citri]
MSTSLLLFYITLSYPDSYLFVPFCLKLMASSSPAISSKVEDTADGNAAALASCIFCKIAASGGEKTNTNILYQDNDVVAFPDIKPAAKHHTLVISKQHVLNAKVLTSEHKALVQKMVDTGKKLMQEQGIELDDVRYGFHWPPFYSIGHLHLHVIAPVSEMSFLSKIIFKPNTWWFVTVSIYTSLFRNSYCFVNYKEVSEVKMR